MRTEEQIRERIQKLLQEAATLRQQAARTLLSDNADDQWRAEELLGRLRHTDSTVRALDWALGQKA